MDPRFIIIIAIVCLVGLVLLWALLSVGSPFRSEGVTRRSSTQHLRNLVAAQRAAEEAGETKHKTNLAVAAAAEGELSRKSTNTNSRITLEKKFRYAKWPITPLQFRFIQVLATLAFFIPMYQRGSVAFMGLALLLVPLVVGAVLDAAVDRRFRQFDVDYPVLLLSYVGLLKTGMNTITAFEAAAKGLAPSSLARAEVELLIERLRLGLTEDQAISSFGEDIPHPEIELFVQSLLLSKKVGGKLSDTLERLTRQVRKRQQFRSQAVGAVAMERNSLYMIALIMGSVMLYLLYKSPELITPAFSHPLGLKVFEGGIFLILVGFFWSRQVSKIKI